MFRYGGDEFLISLPGADLAVGQIVIEHLRDGIAQTPIMVSGLDKPIRTTASFGLALLEPDISVEVHRQGGQSVTGSQGGRAKPRIQLGSRGHDRHDLAARDGG